MASTKISELPAVTTIDQTFYTIVDNGITTSKYPLTNMAYESIVTVPLTPVNPNLVQTGTLTLKITKPFTSNICLVTLTPSSDFIVQNNSNSTVILNFRVQPLHVQKCNIYTTSPIFIDNTPYHGAIFNFATNMNINFFEAKSFTTTDFNQLNLSPASTFKMNANGYYYGYGYYI